MAIQSLTEEQIQSWSREEKDRWWLENVYRGEMPQLTWRSAITGFMLGGVLSATNLYVGAKTGWTLGVGLTSVILAFAMFKAMSKVGLANEFTVLENNAMQSIATSAGYMTAPLISSLAAYMLIKNDTIPWWQMMAWNVVLSTLGVLVAFPMKRRFINDEQQPFPEGRACGVVLDALYTGGEKVGIFKAKALAVAAAIGGGLQLCMGHGYQTFFQVKLLQMKEVWFHIPEQIDTWYYQAAAKWGLPIPTLAGVDIRQLGLRLSLDVAMIGAGGLMGVRIATSCLIGAVLNYAVIAPWMISLGEITPKAGVIADGTAVFGRTYILNGWSLWWGISMMVVSSLVALFAKPKVILSAFQGLWRKRDAGEASADPLKDIELPLWISFVGIPLVTLIAVWMGHAWFGVHWWHGLLAVPLIILLTLIAANATALTSTTPTGSLSKITQFTFGALDRSNPATNLMTAGMTAEVASNASNLLMDIKPGYMLGAKPRQQAVGHLIGIVAGALASTPLFFLLFLNGWERGAPIEASLITESFSMPSALQWKGVADLIASGGQSLKQSALISMFIAGAVAAGMEVTRVISKGKKMPLSPLAIGLGVVIPPDSTFMMWCGAMLFTWMARRNPTPGTRGHLLWVDTQEPICAGLIAGAALIGIGDKLVEVFLL
jgi:OPT family oligopeptide transporter